MKKHVALFIGLVAISGSAFAGDDAPATKEIAKATVEAAKEVAKKAPGMLTRAYSSARDAVTSSAKYVSDKAVQAGTWAADKTAAPREAVSTFVKAHKTATIVTGAVVATALTAYIIYKLSTRKSAKKEAEVNCYCTN